MKLEKVFNNIDDVDIRNKLSNNLGNTIKIIQDIDCDFDKDMINVYIGLRVNEIDIKMTNIEQVINEIECNGYSEIMGVLIYKDLYDLRDFVLDQLEEKLTDSYEVDRLFDKDTIIDYFIEGTSLQQVAKEMSEETDEYTEYLRITPEVLCKTKNGNEYYFAALY